MSRARVAVLKVISKELPVTDTTAQYGVLPPAPVRPPECSLPYHRRPVATRQKRPEVRSLPHVSPAKAFSWIIGLLVYYRITADGAQRENPRETRQGLHRNHGAL
jgi:hypothetical protein